MKLKCSNEKCGKESEFDPTDKANVRTVKGTNWPHVGRTVAYIVRCPHCGIPNEVPKHATRY